MDLERIKNEVIGQGIRRMHYEQRFYRLRNEMPYTIGKKMGMSEPDSILLQEIFEFKVYMIIEQINNYQSN